MRILIVDDSSRKAEQIRAVCEGAAASEHLDLVQTGSVVSALAKLEEQPFDVVILDLHLPFRDGESPKKDAGLQLLAEIKAPIAMPRLGIALTEYEDLRAGQQERFAALEWRLLHFSDSVSAWKQELADALSALALEIDGGPPVGVSDEGGFDQVVRDRLGWIAEKVGALRDDVSSSQGRYLRHVNRHGAVTRIVYSATAEPERFGSETAAFYFSVDNGELRISSQMKRAWLKMQELLKLSAQAFADSVDNFVLHELFHLGQQLTTERHGDIRNAQSVLRVVDYHADANAVLAMGELHGMKDLSSPESRREFARLFLAVLHQMYVFDVPQPRDAMLPSRFIRHFTWHYHYHRMLRFQGPDPFGAQPLLVEPAFNFRGLIAGKAIPRNWPEVEDANAAKDKPHLWIAVPNRFGVPCVHRFLSTDAKNFSLLFDGIFNCDHSSTSRFIGELLNDIGELIGRAGSTE